VPAPIVLNGCPSAPLIDNSILTCVDDTLMDIVCPASARKTYVSMPFSARLPCTVALVAPGAKEIRLGVTVAWGCGGKVGTPGNEGGNVAVGNVDVGGIDVEMIVVGTGIDVGGVSELHDTPATANKIRITKFFSFIVSKFQVASFKL